MSQSTKEQANAHTTLTRRSFLKASGATAGAAVVASAASGMFSTGGWLKPAEAHARSEEKTAHTYHQSHCGGMCSLKCTVRDGRLVLIEPNSCGEDRYETICLKGISEVQHIYGKGRVQTPLRRVGDRGSNKFEPVPWDTALDEIAEKIKAIQSKNGKDAIMVCASAEADFPFLAAMLGAQTGGFDGIDVGTGNGLDPAVGMGGGYAMCAPEARDWTRSKLVLTVGSNYCESSLPNVRTFFEAKEAGAKMITVDPHFSTTASKSDEWVPIEPGTDAALFLGMISYILDNGLADKTFMRRYTSLPFLVDKSTGKLIRDHREDPQAEAPETGEQNPFFVIDANGSPVSYAQTTSPRLSGSVSVDGVEACTVYDLLVDVQKEYTLPWASKITGIPANKIAEIATLYAEGPSSLALGWGGNDKMSNADIAGHAAAVLTAITGNIGKDGAGVGVYVGASYGGYAATLGAWATPENWATAASAVSIYDMRTKDNNCKGAIFCGDYIAQHMANMNLTQEWAKRLDLIVSIDPYFTEGAKWSDYVLPSTTRFEYDEEYGNVKSGYSQIVVQEKVIDPLFEAKTDLWIQRQLAIRLGIKDGLPKTARARVDAILSTSVDPDVARLTIEDIAKNNGVWPVAGREAIRQVATDFTFATTSGRIDLYYDSLVDFNQALPTWESCSEAFADNPKRDKYPLQLANTRTRFRIHNQFNDSSWLKQYYEPTMDVNPVELESRGIKTGDTVEVSNDRGSFKVRVHGNPAIRPGSARLYEGATADYTAGGNMQSVTNDTMIERGYQLMCGPVIPFSDTLVQIKKA